MAMTMRRTRHKLEPLSSLEPQCDVPGIKRGRHTRDTLQNKQAKGTHESSVGVLVRVNMLQVCGHIKHVVVLVVLRIRVIISVIVNVPTYSLFTCM